MNKLKADFAEVTIHIGVLLYTQLYQERHLDEKEQRSRWDLGTFVSLIR